MSALAQALLHLWATATAAAAVLLTLVVAVQGGVHRWRRRPRRHARRRPSR